MERSSLCPDEIPAYRGESAASEQVQLDKVLAKAAVEAVAGAGAGALAVKVPLVQAVCVFLNCGHRVSHIAGQSCSQKECPERGTQINKSLKHRKENNHAMG